MQHSWPACLTVLCVPARLSPAEDVREKATKKATEPGLSRPAWGLGTEVQRGGAKLGPLGPGRDGLKHLLPRDLRGSPDAALRGPGQLLLSLGMCFGCHKAPAPTPGCSW